MLQQLYFLQCFGIFAFGVMTRKKPVTRNAEASAATPVCSEPSFVLQEPAQLIVHCCQTRLSPHQSLTNKILNQQSVLTKSSALIHNYPCNSYCSFYHPLALIPIIPSRTVSTLLSLGISHTTRI